MNKKTLLICTIMMLLLSLPVYAQPVGVTTIQRGESERAGGSPIAQVSEGGNITGMDVNGTEITGRWQGYYGNISGKITVGSAIGHSLYDWDLVTASGEIFAANHSSVTWSNLNCVNFTSNYTLERYNESTMNAFIGYTTEADRAKADSINGTFNLTFGDDAATLDVGGLTFNNADNCSMVALNTDTGYQTTDFQEILMTDNVSVVFTAIVEDDLTGFNGVTADFEMLVGVNGTTQYSTRDYYFFTELG